MIDNPLPAQVESDYDQLYISDQYNEHCTDTAKEIAKDNNLHPDYYEPFIEFYIEECRESDKGYFLFAVTKSFSCDAKYIIDMWWDHNKDLYETKTPYI